MQERKEKLGEKITTLQQLVSPYGKVRNISLSLKTRILEFKFFIKMLSYGLYMESYADWYSLCPVRGDGIYPIFTWASKGMPLGVLMLLFVNNCVRCCEVRMCDANWTCGLIVFLGFVGFECSLPPEHTGYKYGGEYNLIYAFTKHHLRHKQSLLCCEASVIGFCSWLRFQELVHYSLRSKGLCLVPIECTAGLPGSNGADIWAPIKTGSPRF